MGRKSSLKFGHFKVGLHVIIAVGYPLSDWAYWLDHDLLWEDVHDHSLQ